MDIPSVLRTVLPQQAGLGGGTRAGSAGQEVTVQNPEQQDRIHCNRVTVMISLCTSALSGPHRDVRCQV